MAGLSHSSEMGQGAGMANDLTLSSEPGKEPRAQAGLVGRMGTRPLRPPIGRGCL